MSLHLGLKAKNRSIADPGLQVSARNSLPDTLAIILTPNLFNNLPLLQNNLKKDQMTDAHEHCSSTKSAVPSVAVAEVIPSGETVQSTRVEVPG